MVHPSIQDHTSSQFTDYDSFLPYTIDFKATKRRNSRSQSINGDYPTDIRAWASKNRRMSLGLTPGATTEDEKIFRPYVSSSAEEVPVFDDPDGLAPSEPRPVSWGQSRKFNQPPSKAEVHIEPSILGSHAPSAGPDGKPINATSPDLHTIHSGDWVVKAAEHGNGALRNAVMAAENAGILTDDMWVGTLGMPTDLLDDKMRASIAERLEGEFESLTVFVDDNAFEGHYTHFCRNVLWPAFHYQMQETPRHTEYDDYSWKQYVKVNEVFADVIAARWRPGDSIWVHDYHLLLLPLLLREKLPNPEIGFFLHTSFPSFEVFRCLNLRDALLKGILGADLIGFQTDEYCYHFLHACSRLLGLEVSTDSVQLLDRYVPVEKFPFSIDPRGLSRARNSTEVKGWISRIAGTYQDKRLVVARDRLDGPSGVKQKLLAYEQFLKDYPEWKENVSGRTEVLLGCSSLLTYAYQVVLIQIVTSSVDNPDLEADISKIAMRVNSTYSSLTYQPLVLLRHDTSYSQLLALLHVADVFMVTCLRDGMNLMCHEYVYCQDGKLSPHRYGSLILSEFAGSASIFSKHELLVNPWDSRQCAEALSKALEMSPEQKRRDWEYLHRQMAPHTATSWCKMFRGALSAAHGSQLSHEPETLSTSSIKQMKNSYDNSSLRLFLLGDRSILSASTSSSTLVKQRLLISLLNKLTDDPHNLVYLTSEETPEHLESFINEDVGIPITHGDRVGLIAEDGYFLREVGTSDSDSSGWKTLIDDTESLKDWKKGMKKMMKFFQERTDGSWIEEKHCLLTFRFDHVANSKGANRQASELADQVNGARNPVITTTTSTSTSPKFGIQAIHTEGAVTFKPSNVTKATAASLVLEHLNNRKNNNTKKIRPDFIFVAGSQHSDEVVFQWANDLTTSSTSYASSDHDNDNDTLSFQNGVVTLFLGKGRRRATRAKARPEDDITIISVIDRLTSSVS